MRPHPLFLCVLMFISSTAVAAPGKPLERVNDQRTYMQGKRNAVQDSINETSTPDQLREAAARFEDLIVELDQPAMRDLANGSTYLRAERLNNLIPLAEVYLRLGMKDKALEALEQSQRSIWLPIEFDKAPAFKSLRNEPRFAAINSRARLGTTIFDTPARAAGYREKLSVEERIAGLSLFWHEARQNFVYFDHVSNLDWNKVYLDYLPKVMAARNTREYYDVLMQLAPLLQDGHTNIYPPDKLTSKYYSRPPIRTALIEDKVVVVQVSSPSLEKIIKIGDEIIAIDGKPTKAYAQQNVAPFVSSSTPQDKIVRIYTYQLLAGDAVKPVHLSLAGSDGSQRNVSVRRSSYSDVVKQPEFEFKLLKGNIAYIALDHFESDAGVQAFEKAWPAIQKAAALIIDVRNNGGGSTEFGYQILRHLTNKPIIGSRSYVRLGDPVIRAQHGNSVSWLRLDGYVDERARNAQVFTNPVAVLSGPRSFSAAEDFLVAFDQLQRGLIVGEASGGSTGQPLTFDLPGGGMARICVKRDTYQDGREFVGKGVIPQIEARPTLQSVRTGDDPVLAAALLALAR
ncbi:S41 family peptidase [Janthinobacterium sp. RB2R34]|uniref:S41 family peptidase n=1 Tax=Janthinobacterium sp. RB2R34 TaxID=3424193 RepID=UPI003F273890